MNFVARYVSHDYSNRGLKTAYHQQTSIRECMPTVNSLYIAYEKKHLL